MLCTWMPLVFRLDWGIRLWFGEKGLGREGIKFGMQRMRKKHRAPKHM